MKKLCVILLLALALAGCASIDYEYVSDNGTIPALPNTRHTLINLPATVAEPTFAGEDGSCVYVCPEYEIHQQVLPGGDIPKTFLTVTGKSPEDLTVLQTMQQGYKRYDCMFAASGEGEQNLCRLTVLDDGYYHYILCIQTGECDYSRIQKDIEQIASSFCLSVST